MAWATVSVAATTIGPIGVRQQLAEHDVASEAPSIWAAMAKSRSRSERIWASTTRATSIQLVAAMMTVIMTRLGLDEGGEGQQQEDAREAEQGVDEAHQHGAEPARRR